MDKINSDMIKSLTFISVGAALAFSVQQLYYFVKHRKTLSNITNKSQTDHKDKSKNINTELSLLREQLKRNYEFFGEESMEKIKKSFVCVVGLGGVGSHAVMTLIRSGVQKIRVIDYDIITLSSLNRHAFAMREDVGLFKTKVIKSYCNKIFPLTEIEDIDDAITDDTKDKYLQGVDYVIDCIDDLNNKCSLLRFCSEKGIPVISSMGAGARINPFLIRLSDLNTIKGEAISKKLRLLYKKRYNINIPNGIKCVFSIEQTTRGLTEMHEHQKENKDIYQINVNERIRTIPVFASIPAIFGQSLAAVCLCDLSGEKAFANYNEQEDIEEKKDTLLNGIEISKIIEEFREEESKRRKLE